LHAAATFCVRQRLTLANAQSPASSAQCCCLAEGPKGWPVGYDDVAHRLPGWFGEAVSGQNRKDYFVDGDTSDLPLSDLAALHQHHLQSRFSRRFIRIAGRPIQPPLHLLDADCVLRTRLADLDVEHRGRPNPL
jgi:hypothetical protein